MNALTSHLPPLEPEDELDDTPGWVLQKLTPRHKTIAALLAQGMKQVQIASLVDCTPQYVHMLTKQPLMREFIREKAEVAGIRLDAMFEQSVEVIATVMKDGSNNEKLKAARLQLEATKRIGRGDGLPNSNPSTDEHLVRLADRLVGLLSSTHQRVGNTYENGTPAEDAVVLRSTERQSGQEAEEEE